MSAPKGCKVYIYSIVENSIKNDLENIAMLISMLPNQLTNTFGNGLRAPVATHSIVLTETL